MIRLTGLANRRSVDERIEWRISPEQTFCVVMVDLNNSNKSMTPTDTWRAIVF